MISEKFLLKVHGMAAAQVELKSPFHPPCSKGEFSPRILTPLWQRGEGEIFEWKRRGNYVANF
jgi:hypothetical protein